MLTLYTFSSALGVHSPSPYTVKAEMLLKMAGLPFEKSYGNPGKAPKGKYPVLEDGDETIADSGHIQTWLEQKKGIDFDGHLTKEQHAVTTAFRRLVQDHFYFINMHFRWNEHGDAVRDNYFGMVPSLMRGFVFRMVRKSVVKTLHLQGIGRHSRDEIIELGCQDVEAIATHLGDNPYFMGDKISSIDASVFGALHNLIDCELASPIKDACMKHANLIAYCARINKELFDG